MHNQLTQAPPNILLKIKGLKVIFNSNPTVHAVDNVDLNIKEGQILGLVGESGSGKTVLSLSILRLLNNLSKSTEGNILWQGRNLQEINAKELRKIRGAEIAMIFQNPQDSLNPMRKIGSQMKSVIQLHRKISGKNAHIESLKLLNEVQINNPERVLVSYPFELSGGMCQRIMIAMALACQPKLLIADEPTASLDVTIQAQIMDLLLDLRDKFNMSILLISHDLGVIARMCDEVAVMYQGRIVETGDAISVYESPQHPYTQALLRSVPIPDPRRREKLQIFSTESSKSVYTGKGCRFQPRCPVAVDDCTKIDPQILETDSQQHLAACIHSQLNLGFSTKNDEKREKQL